MDDNITVTAFQWHCHIAALDITTGGHWQQGCNDSLQVHIPLFHERIDHLNLAQSSNTSHQHTNIQMRWLPLYDGAVPS